MRMFRLFTSGVYSLMYILSTSSGWGGRGFFCMLLIDLLYIEVKPLLMMMLIAFLIGYSVIIFYKCWGELYWKFSHVVFIETIIMLCVWSHQYSWRLLQLFFHRVWLWLLGAFVYLSVIFRVDSVPPLYWFLWQIILVVAENIIYVC